MPDANALGLKFGYISIASLAITSTLNADAKGFLSGR